MNERKYISFSFKPFNAIRSFCYGSILMLVSFALCGFDFFSALLLSFIINSFFVVIYIVSSYTVVSRRANDILITNLWCSELIHNVESIESWWSYDFGIESPAINEGSHGKSAGISNKINCFLKLSSKTQDLYLYEQIDLGSKFPNNHVYNYMEVVDRTQLHRVWDIDSCIQKLNLQSLMS